MSRLILILFLLGTSVQAHVVEQLFAEFSRDGERWSLCLRFDAGLALPEMRQDPDAPQPPHAWLTERSVEELDHIREETRLYLREYLSLQTLDAMGAMAPVSFELDFPAWQSQPPRFEKRFTDTGYAYFDVVLRGDLPAGSSLELLLSEGEHPDLAIGFSNEHFLTAYPGKSLTLIQRDGSAPSAQSSFFSFLDYGYRHVIPEGWDHVLFMLSLVCLSFAWRQLLSQSLIFTLGHTLTLGLVVSGSIPTPGPDGMKWIEVMIAGTILYIAVQNLLTKEVRAHRLALVFVFGLIHGLGFASVLGDKIRAAGDILMPLVAANLGVELGQVSVIGGAWLLLYPARKKAFFPKLLKVISALIALPAAYWVLTRALG